MFSVLSLAGRLGVGCLYRTKSVWRRGRPDPGGDFASF
jgi:hypothetical protein